MHALGVMLLASRIRGLKDKRADYRMTVFYISMQKSGTNAIKRLLGGMINTKDRAHQYQIHEHPHKEVVKVLEHLTSHSHAHLCYTDTYAAILRGKPGLKVFFSYRDPRDVVLSFVHWMSRGETSSWIHLPDDVLERKVREGWLDGKGRAFFASYAGWLSQDWVFKVRYEDLMLNFEQTCEELHSFLNEPSLGSVSVWRRRWNKEPKPVTFRKGLVGEWSSRFKGKLLDDLLRELEPVILQYGYSL